MANKTWTEFFFGTEEDRKRAKKVLKEMRPDYERPGEKKAEKKAVIDRRAPWTSAEAKAAKQTVVRTGKGDRDDRPKTTQEGMRKANDDMAKMQLERLKKSKATAPPKPKARPAGGMTEAKRRAAAEFRKKAQGQKKVEAPKAERPKFRGNWVGAKPTEMQARGGRRIKRANLLDFLKNR